MVFVLVLLAWEVLSVQQPPYDAYFVVITDGGTARLDHFRTLPTAALLTSCHGRLALLSSAPVLVPSPAAATHLKLFCVKYIIYDDPTDNLTHTDIKLCVSSTEEIFIPTVASSSADDAKRQLVLLPILQALISQRREAVHRTSTGFYFSF